MPIPTPHKGEKEKEFIGRCMTALKDESRPQEQKLAICYGAFKKRKEEKMQNLRLNFSVPIKENMQIGDDFVIRGVAINETVTRNGTKFIAEELLSAAHTLRDKPILKDHNNSVDSIVGRTTQNVYYNNQNRCVDFEGKIMDVNMQRMINDGRVSSVSVGAVVRNLEETDYEEAGETRKCMIAKGIDFVELSLVAVPADPNAGFAFALSEKMGMEGDTAVKDEMEKQRKEHPWASEDVLRKIAEDHVRLGAEGADDEDDEAEEGDEEAEGESKGSNCEDDKDPIVGKPEEKAKVVNPEPTPVSISKTDILEEKPKKAEEPDDDDEEDEDEDDKEEEKTINKQEEKSMAEEPKAEVKVDQSAEISKLTEQIAALTKMVAEMPKPEVKVEEKAELKSKVAEKAPEPDTHGLVFESTTRGVNFYTMPKNKGELR